MPRYTQGEPVGFHQPAPPDHLAHLDTDQSNHLIDYALTNGRPVEHTAAKALNGVLIGGLAVALAVIVVLMFGRNDEYVTVAFAAVAGALATAASSQFAQARHGRRNTHITQIIAAYEVRLIEQDSDDEQP